MFVPAVKPTAAEELAIIISSPVVFDKVIVLSEFSFASIPATDSLIFPTRSE